MSSDESITRLPEETRLKLERAWRDTIGKNSDIKAVPIIETKQVIFGTPVSKSNGYRTGGGRIYKSEKVTNYEKVFAAQCGIYRNANIAYPFLFEIDAYFPTKANDLDGVFKCVLDNLQNIGAIVNDNLCYEIIARKHIDKINPRIEFSISRL